MAEETAGIAGSPRAHGLHRFRPRLEMRQTASGLRTAAMIAAGLAVGLGLSALILIASGVRPGDLVNEFIVQIFASPKNISAVLVQAAPMIIVGLSASIAFKARFWNIGIEGQMIFGAIGAALTLGARRGGVLASLIVLPLFIPVLIFGSSAIEATIFGLDAGPPLLILGAFLLAAIPLTPFATAAALRLALE